jgi:hypothetical protein
MYENIIAIHNVFFFLNYIVKFSTSSIFKKINKDIFETKKFKKKEKKKKKKSILGKKKKKPAATVNIPRVLEYSIMIVM